MTAKRRVGLIICSMIAALCLSRTSVAGPTECQEAITDYKSARSDISTALQLYANCVASSDGHDDCSSEFEALKSAQDDFEDAVSRYDSDCQ
jgi:hypothetical protein